METFFTWLYLVMEKAERTQFFVKFMVGLLVFMAVFAFVCAILGNTFHFITTIVLAICAFALVDELKK